MSLSYENILSLVVDKVINESNQKIKSMTLSELNEMCDNSELKSVIKSFDVQKQLNPKFWVNNKINSRIRLKLLDIADEFFDSLEVDWVKPTDIIFTGSLANYNWSKYSDIDLHIVLDFKDVDEKTVFVKDYFDSKKKIWNEEHENLTIYGFPVELYVQDKNENHSSSGVYSLEKNKWIVKPNRDDFISIKLNKDMIVNKSAKIIRQIDDLEKKIKLEHDTEKIDELSTKVKQLFDKVKGIRKESLKNGNEMSIGNIIWKVLRRMNYINKLVDLKTQTYDKLNTIK